MLQPERYFCLQQIKAVYGYDYRSDWHADLDSLLDAHGIYSATQCGAFITKKNQGSIIGVGGLRGLSTHQASWERLGDRYGGPVGALWRVYVDNSVQGRGIGTKIVAGLEQRAVQVGYTYLYLHTSRNNPNAVLFWEKRGYVIFAEDNNHDRTVHMHKKL